MLVLSRRPTESIIIGNREIIITILGVRDGHIRIGIEAPKRFTVHREEVFKRIEAEHAGEPVAESVTAPT
jgi:carbon storage regulator